MNAFFFYCFIFCKRLCKMLFHQNEDSEVATFCERRIHLNILSDRSVQIR